MFSFAVKAGGLTTAGVGYYFRYEILQAIYKVYRESASSMKRLMTRQGIQQTEQGGAHGVVQRVEQRLENGGDIEGAHRLSELRREAQSGNASPGHMI